MENEYINIRQEGNLEDVLRNVLYLNTSTSQVMKRLRKVIGLSILISKRYIKRIQQIGNAIPPLLAQVFAAHISSYGFSKKNTLDESGKLIAYSLTKADAMSPALRRTNLMLSELAETPTAY